MHDTFAVTETSGAQRGVQIDFSPVGAHLLWRTPMHEVTGRVVALEAIFGRAGVLLHEALACAGGWEGRFALLYHFSLERLEAAVSPVPWVPRALGRLRPTGGRVRVETVAAELGPSHRPHVAG